MAKKPRTIRRFTTVDRFLEEEGTREEFQTAVIKEVLAWQISRKVRLELV